MTYSIGIDFGTGSGRAFLINTENGEIEEQYIRNYTHGTIEGELGGEKLPQNFALQNANDYMEIIEIGIPTII